MPSIPRLHHLSLTLLAIAAGGALIIAGCNGDGGGNNDSGSNGPIDTSVVSSPTLVGRAVLPAATFAPGPSCGYQITPGINNGIPSPFFDRQPVQGFSAVLADPDQAGVYWAMSDNGFGSLENSADYELRVYRIQPNFKTSTNTKAVAGGIDVLGFFALRDPNKKIPFTITNFFSADRILTGADFDIESMQRGSDGTLWFGDEFGPFLIHTSADGVVLEAPIALPDLDNAGKQIRSPQNPMTEEASAVRLMNAARAHARRNGGTKTPVFSPYHVMLKDGNTTNDHYARDSDVAAPKSTGAGLAPAASDIFDVAQLQNAGYPVVCWTVNDSARMTELLKLKLNGVISDRPDLLLAAVQAYDADGNGTAGDFMTADGLIDITKFDAQGHRGGRNLRPENTLPAMEVALDNLMTTLELDCGITSDGKPVLMHDPYISADKARRADGAPYAHADEILIKNRTLADIQSTYIADKVFRGPSQSNDRALSPAAVAFAASRSLIDPYVMPSLQQVFEFVTFYADYYKNGAGKTHPDAGKRVKNAQRVRFNIETKINPRSGPDAEHGIIYKDRTSGPYTFATAVAEIIVTNNMQDRADIQSFDFRSLLHVQQLFPAIRTVYLFGDFPIYADRSNPDSDDSTNLQDEDGANTPWLAGMVWPYRKTTLGYAARSQRSGGFEGMAISPDAKTLYPLLELPLANPTNAGQATTILIHPFDIATRTYTGARHLYPFDAKGTNIGDFILTDATKGLIIERDNTQGDINGFKKIYRIQLNAAGTAVTKTEVVDLTRIADPNALSKGGLTGDVGLGGGTPSTFAFPFVTIEDVIIIDPTTIGVINDNNFPFSVGRHVGAKKPDDNEFIMIRLPAAAMGTTPMSKG